MSRKQHVNSQNHLEYQGPDSWHCACFVVAARYITKMEEMVMNGLKKTVLGVAAALVVGLGVVIPQAQADFMIRVTDITAGTPSDVVTDNMLGDINGSLGLINSTFNTTNFQIVTTIGTSKPLGGNSDYLARMDLLNVNVTSSTGGGALLIEITDTDFSLHSPTGFGSFAGSIGGTLGLSANNTLNVDYYYDPNNAEFGIGGTVLNSALFSGPGGFNHDLGPIAVNGVSGQFSLTQAVMITMNANDIISYDSDLMVQTPEPTSFLLFGSGLLGLGYLGRRKHQKV